MDMILFKKIIDTLDIVQEVVVTMNERITRLEREVFEDEV